MGYAWAGFYLMSLDLRKTKTNAFFSVANMFLVRVMLPKFPSIKWKAGGTACRVTLLYALSFLSKYRNEYS